MIDLHTHSNFSDGTLSPGELMREARLKGLTAVALTDHDTLAGLKEAETAARREGILFIRGVELSLSFPRGEFHLLGLGLQDKGTNLILLEENLAQLRNARDIRNRTMVEKMRAHGISVEYEEIQDLAGSSAVRDTASGKPESALVVGRPHFARFLVNRGIVRNITEAFEKYLTRGQPFYEPKKILSLEEAVELISRAGGLAVVAHPLSLQMNWENLEREFAAWKEKGIFGVETLHPSATRGKTRKLEKLAEKYGLPATAGSDYHGSHIPRRRLGRTGWGSKIPGEYSSFLEHLTL